MKNEKSLTAILFDFDGTLVNTTPLVLRSFHATWEKVFGFTYDDLVFIRTFGMLLNTGIREVMELSIAEGRMARPDDFEMKINEVLGVYRAFNSAWHDEMIEPFPGMIAILQELRLRGFRLGIVSSKLRSGVLRALNLYGMANLFDVIIGAEDTTNHKPHPEPLLIALSGLEVATNESLYVGDSTHDIAAGRAAQMLTAAAAWGPFPQSELESLHPDYLLITPRDLLQF